MMTSVRNLRIWKRLRVTETESEGLLEAKSKKSHWQQKSPHSIWALLEYPQ